MPNQKVIKRYVAVDIHTDEAGQTTPKLIYWPDGRRFEVDRILEVKKAASTRAGGLGLRYKVRILGKETFLFFEDPRWFAEEIVKD